MFSTTEISNKNKVEQNNNVSEKVNVKEAKKLLKLIDDTFDTYIKEQSKKLQIVPYISSKKFDISMIATKNFDTVEQKRIQRKLLMLQKIYIEGMPKEEFDEDYLTNKTFANDKKSLIDDLAVLLFGIDGLSYRILERKGYDIENILV